MLEQPVTPRIWWRTKSDGNAVTIRSTCIVPDSAQAESRLAEAEAWLRRNLANHGIPSKLIIEQAASAGIAEKTLRRAFMVAAAIRPNLTAVGCGNSRISPKMAKHL